MIATAERKTPVKITLNKTTVEKLQPPASGRVYHYDNKTPGLAVCVTAAGAKTFYLYRKVHGRPLRHRIGAVADITVEAARDIAQTLIGEIVQGVDVQARRRSAREELTFGELFGRWMEYAREHKRTHPEDQRKYDKFLATWAGRRLSTITTTDVERMHHAVKVKSGLYQANRVLELAKSMFRRGRETKIWLGVDPTIGVKAFEEQSRERFLQQGEVRAFFKALKGLSADMQDFFQLLLLTGQRRGAVQAMRWGDIDMDNGIWTVPAEYSKKKRSMTLPLVGKSLEILDQRAKVRTDSQYVFATHSKTGHLVEPRRQWDALRTAAGVKDLRMHDLRRTLGSWQANLGTSMNIIGRSLGHSDGSKATAVYARLQMEPVRESVTAATNAILAASKPKAKQKKKTTSKGGRSSGKKAK